VPQILKRREKMNTKRIAIIALVALAMLVIMAPTPE
jgi:hypothetical protein